MITFRKLFPTTRAGSGLAAIAESSRHGNKIWTVFLKGERTPCAPLRTARATGCQVCRRVLKDSPAQSEAATDTCGCRCEPDAPSHILKMPTILSHHHLTRWNASRWTAGS